jgi:hypothetical protein
MNPRGYARTLARCFRRDAENGGRDARDPPESPGINSADKVRFDGEAIRKDGLFVPKDLKGLNPQNLK